LGLMFTLWIATTWCELGILAFRLLVLPLGALVTAFSFVMGERGTKSAIVVSSTMMYASTNLVVYGLFAWIECLYVCLSIWSAFGVIVCIVTPYHFSEEHVQPWIAALLLMSTTLAIHHFWSKSH